MPDERPTFLSLFSGIQPGDSTSDSNERAGDASARSRSMSTDEASSGSGGPKSSDGTTSEGSTPIIIDLANHGQEGKGWSDRHAFALERGGHQAVLTSSAEASPAKTYPSPAGGRASRGSGRASSSSSPESLALFAPDGFSSRTYPDSFPLTVAEISPSFSRRWPTSGMAWPGECWTLDTSEFPSGAVECSLSDILEPDPPRRFFLSSKAARGILRRAERRGRTLPPPLEAALESVAGQQTPKG